MRIALCEDDSAQADMFVRLLDKTADKLGIKAETEKACQNKITIHMEGKAESLNASVAAAILMWEMMK